MTTELRADRPATEESDPDRFRPGMREGFERQLPDPDPEETAQRIAALDDNAGRERAGPAGTVRPGESSKAS